MHELFHLLIECRAANDDFVEVAAKSCNHLVTNFLVDFLVDDRHSEQQAHTIVLNLRENFLPNDFLNHERYGNDDCRAHFGKRLCDDGWRGDTVEIEHMASVQEFEDKLERHSVHVCHRQDAQHVIATFNLVAQHMLRKIVIAPKGAIRNHHSFRKACRSTGIVNHRHLIGRLLFIIMYVFLSKIFREFLAEHLIEVFSRIG